MKKGKRYSHLLFMAFAIVAAVALVSTATMRRVVAEQSNRNASEAHRLMELILYAQELLADTEVSYVGGTDIPTYRYWVTRENFTAFENAIAAAQAVIDRTSKQTVTITVSSGNHYRIPIAVENALLPTNFTLIFDPDKIVFVGMTENEAILSLSSDNLGVVSFRYLGGSSTNNPTRTGVINRPLFEAVADGEVTIVIKALHD